MFIRNGGDGISVGKEISFNNGGAYTAVIQKVSKDANKVGNISYPPCKKGIRPGICEKPVVSHEAGGRLRYSWLNADTRPYPFFTRKITNLSSFFFYFKIYIYIYILILCYCSRSPPPPPPGTFEFLRAEKKPPIIFNLIHHQTNHLISMSVVFLLFVCSPDP